MFKKLFGGSKEASAPIPPPTVKAATQTINSIQQLADQEENLEKRKALIEKKMEAELQKARELNKAGKKQQALMCLKRKKLLETEMQNLDNMVRAEDMHGDRTWALHVARATGITQPGCSP